MACKIGFLSPAFSDFQEGLGRHSSKCYWMSVNIGWKHHAGIAVVETNELYGGITQCSMWNASSWHPFRTHHPEWMHIRMHVLVGSGLADLRGGRLLLHKQQGGEELLSRVDPG